MDDLERLLSEFRPIGPPPELHDQVLRLAASGPIGHTHPFRSIVWRGAAWLPAFAATIFIATFYGPAANARHAMDATRDVTDLSWSVSIIDPFSGQALRYERQSDAFAITSVAPIRGPFREVAVRVRLRSIVK